MAKKCINLMNSTSCRNDNNKVETKKKIPCLEAQKQVRKS